jgi:hypothetical protein
MSPRRCAAAQAVVEASVDTEAMYARFPFVG